MKHRRRRVRGLSQYEQLEKNMKAALARECAAQRSIDLWKQRALESDAELKALRDTVRRIGRIAQMVGQDGAH